MRLELLGGGTDMAYFYRSHPGKVLNAALDLSVYLLLAPSFDGKFFVRYKKNEIADLPSGLKNSRVKVALEYFKVKEGLEVVSYADIPAGSGLGSSSSFCVGLVNALSTLAGQKLSSRQMAELACHLEIDVLKEPIGKQDQYAAALGGLNLMTFQKNGRVMVKPLGLGPRLEKKLESHLILVYTGSTRQASDILAEQPPNPL
ncbi:hypothetical protein ACFL0Y_02925 [Patescibacteria group bacterium]